MMAAPQLSYFFHWGIKLTGVRWFEEIRLHGFNIDELFINDFALVRVYGHNSKFFQYLFLREQLNAV